MNLMSSGKKLGGCIRDVSSEKGLLQPESSSERPEVSSAWGERVGGSLRPEKNGS